MCSRYCTLAESRSELKKRQEIGRGLRLCVNQDGERVHDQAVNRLTVIANEAYEDFARELQSELEADGYAFEAANGGQRAQEGAGFDCARATRPTSVFWRLWERIRGRTRYQVEFDTEELIQRCARKVRGGYGGDSSPRSGADPNRSGDHGTRHRSAGHRGPA